MYIEEEKYYTCRYDRVFKDVFLDPKDDSLLKGLLESILKVKINHITLQNTELREGSAYLRRKNLDALLDTNEGIINIEINTSTDHYINTRNYAYLSRIYVNHTLKGDNYNEKEKFIQINFSYNLNDTEYYRIYHVQDEKKKTYIHNLEIYEFNMDKYVKLWYTEDKEKIEENKYLIMMDLPKKELEKFSLKDKVVSKYMNKLNRINEDPAFLNIIDYEQDNKMIMNSIKEQYMEEGLAEGRQKGLTEGRQKGLTEGVLTVAKKMLKSGVSLEEISKYTDLPIDKLKELKKET